MLECTQDEELKKRIELMGAAKAKSGRVGERVPLAIKAESNEQMTKDVYKLMNATLSITPGTGITYIEKGKVSRGAQYPESLNRTFFKAGSSIKKPITQEPLKLPAIPQTANSKNLTILEKVNEQNVSMGVMASTPAKEIHRTQQFTMYGSMHYRSSNRRKHDYSSISINRDKNTSFEAQGMSNNIVVYKPPPTKHSPSKSLLYGSKYKRLSYVSYIKSKLPKKDDERLVEW